ncbi:unnamed protein product [Symbiodinium necroappetens]|uniref:Uncharacterized protein n=1 Tax=Symbiodinium necroappetens TaxID=1628268 RepID=A0A813C235_9DINO|nr:unnamed protein product [Symbiodinium necroappetens]
MSAGTESQEVHVPHQQEAFIFELWPVASPVRMGVGSEPLLGSIGSPVALFAVNSGACPRTTSASFRGDVSEDASCCALRAAVRPQTRKAAAQAMTTASPKLANARSRPANMRQSLREQLLSVLSAVPTYRFSGAFAVTVTGLARWKLSALVPDGTALATGW